MIKLSCKDFASVNLSTEEVAANSGCVAISTRLWDSCNYQTSMHTVQCAREVEDSGGTCCSGGIRMTVLMPPWLPEKSHTSCTCKQFFWSSMLHHQFHHNHLQHRPHHNYHHQNRPQDGTHKAVAIIARMCCRRQRSSFYRQRGRLGSLNHLQTILSSNIQKLQYHRQIFRIFLMLKKGSWLGSLDH